MQNPEQVPFGYGQPFPYLPPGQQFVPPMMYPPQMVPPPQQQQPRPGPRALPRRTVEEQLEMDSRSIFIGRVTDKISEDDLREYFQRFGNIRSCTIPFNRETGLTKGFALIEYDDVDCVERALRNKNVTMKGNLLQLRPKTSKDIFSGKNAADTTQSHADQAASQFGALVDKVSPDKIDAFTKDFFHLLDILEKATPKS